MSRFQCFENNFEDLWDVTGKSAHVEIYLFNKRLPDGTRLRTDDFVDIVHDLMKLCRKFVHTYIAPAPDSDSEEGESGDAFNYDSNDDSNEDW